MPGNKVKHVKVGQIVVTPELPSAPLAGAYVLGATNYPIPAGASFVSTLGSDTTGTGTEAAPWATLRKALDTVANGSTIVMRGGEYRQKPGQLAAGRDFWSFTIQNYPGEVVWFDGSDVVTGWVNNGNGTWTAPFVQTFDHSASFNQGVNYQSGSETFVDYTNYPLAAWPDMVFIDGVRLRQVVSSATPTAVQFKVAATETGSSNGKTTEHTTSSITIGTDPTGKKVRAGRRDYWGIVTGPWLIRGIGFRRYSTSLYQQGTINIVTRGGGTVLENCWVVDSATDGIAPNGAGTEVLRCTILRPGMLAMAGNRGTDNVIENNYITMANWEWFNTNPAAGSTKLSSAVNASFRNNIITKGNRCGAIWLDTDCYTGRIINNWCEDGDIAVEAGARYIVASNWVWGGTMKDAMLVRISDWCKLYNNYLDQSTIHHALIVNDARRNNTNDIYYPDMQWLTRGTEFCNNALGGNKSNYHVFVTDEAGVTPAETMVSKMKGNLFANPPKIGFTGQPGQNYRTYNTTAAFDSAWPTIGGGNTTTSVQAPGLPQFILAADFAEPLPADVAAELGVAPGTKVVGPVLTPPVRMDTVGYDIIVGVGEGSVRGAASDYDGTDAYPANAYQWSWTTNGIVTASEPASNKDSATGMGSLNRMVRAYAIANPERKVLMVNTARAGTGFTSTMHWRRTLTADSNNLATGARDDVLAVLAAAGPNSRVVAVVGEHGTTDAANGTAKATFKAYLQDWIVWFRTAIGFRTVPYLMAQPRADLLATTANSDLDNAQIETASEVSFSAHAASPVGSTYYKADGVNFNAAGVRLIGAALYSDYATITD